MTSLSEFTSNLQISTQSQIFDSDIKYMDDFVTILHPHIKKGLVVMTYYSQPEGCPSLKESGLKTGLQLMKEGVNFGRSVYHPYIFFKAPYTMPTNDKEWDDYQNMTLFEKLNYTYDNVLNLISDPNYIAIRIDTSRTSVFSSEIRCASLPKHKTIEGELMKSKKTVDEFIKTVHSNKYYTKECYKKRQLPVYNLITSHGYAIDENALVQYPLDKCPIERNSEILVKIPHLIPEYFVA
jgi:hypothetical protein